VIPKYVKYGFVRELLARPVEAVSTNMNIASQYNDIRISFGRIIWLKLYVNVTEYVQLHKDA
jgi:hypothetical protein